MQETGVRIRRVFVRTACRVGWNTVPKEPTFLQDERTLCASRRAFDERSKCAGIHLGEFIEERWID
jgi:hypothetical protein